MNTDAGKARFAKATPEGSPYAANLPKVKNASHVVALCARTSVDDAHLSTLLAQEEKDGRFPTPEGKEMQAWTQKQVYLALGTILLGAATLGIDATPIEGFDPQALDQELALNEKGLKSVVMVALGYRSAEDFNAKLPKSRLGAETVITAL
ncbi:MAG: nitroreductase / dihydropteridine reductase [Pseudomonadota bacterium]|nr:nitroreductase / dihydropteridine reductase [Pseudomonadota bacterium]MDQ5917405.1 nitroreductase / dihydropteridine reductase [Pseudomonadota bacterium]MDQ5925677.1 nitroreductase / dihydropteridine reductase [Pseudomonadota bacterium]MDQ5945800.1 nitroreductase / dihydropteridine reductase [Pseudomonadota bacterium]